MKEKEFQDLSVKILTQCVGKRSRNDRYHSRLNQPVSLMLLSVLIDRQHFATLETEPLFTPLNWETFTDLLIRKNQLDLTRDLWIKQISEYLIKWRTKDGFS